MTEEEKVTTEEDSDVSEETTEDTDSNEEESEDSSSQDVDYEAELEAEKKRNPDPDKAKEAFEKRAEKRQEKEEKETGTPLTEERLQEILAEERQQSRIENQSEKISDLVSAMTDNEAEQNLIKEVHKNRRFPEGMSLQEQIEEAYVIANRKRILSTNKELARSLKSKSEKDAASTHRDKQEGPAPKIEPDMAAALKESGYTFNAKEKRYEKKLPNGKTLVKDNALAAPYVLQ